MFFKIRTFRLLTYCSEYSRAWRGKHSYYEQRGRKAIFLLWTCEVILVSTSLLEVEILAPFPMPQFYSFTFIEIFVLEKWERRTTLLLFSVYYLLLRFYNEYSQKHRYISCKTELRGDEVVEGGKEVYFSLKCFSIVAFFFPVSYIFEEVNTIVKLLCQNSRLHEKIFKK